MKAINDVRFVFYYKQAGKNIGPKEWIVSEPVTLGKLIEGNVELALSDDSTLPLNDVDWANDELQVVII